MIHSLLNRIALSSHASRTITYALASHLAYVLFFAAVILIYAQDSIKFPHALLASLCSAVMSRVIVEIIYAFYRRPRPSVHNDIAPLFINSNPSFPSGHAAFFGALAMALALMGTPLALWFAVGTTVMCVARVVAGVHFFSDILGGCMLGVGTTLILFLLLGIY